MKNIMNSLIVLISMIATVNAQGIKFEDTLSWAELQVKAKTENKYIFMDIHATWCTPCKEMSAKTFTLKDVGDFINEKFISVKVQMDQTKDDNEGVKSWYSDAKAIGMKYRVAAYPTILFFTSSGQLMGKSVGYKEAKDMIAEANQAIDNAEKFKAFYARYSNGQRDSALVKGIAKLATKMGQIENAQKIAQEYIQDLDERELFKKENIQFVYQFTTSSKDQSFALIRKYSNKFNAVLGNNAVEVKFMWIIGKEEIEPFIEESSGDPDWKSIENTVKRKYGALGLEAFQGKRMQYALDRKDWGNFGKYYSLYYTTGYGRSQFHINNISWVIFEEVTDPKVLDIAVKTMKYDIEHFDEKSVQAIDTYANLLYKVGKKQEAILWAEKAVQLEEENASKLNGQPNPVFAVTLEKMKAGTPTWPVEEPKK